MILFDLDIELAEYQEFKSKSYSIYLYTNLTRIWLENILFNYNKKKTNSVIKCSFWNDKDPLMNQNGSGRSSTSKMQEVRFRREGVFSRNFYPPSYWDIKKIKFKLILQIFSNFNASFEILNISFDCKV